MKAFLLTLFFSIPFFSQAQYYFPPTLGNEWNTTPISELGWCEDQLPPLMNYLEESGTKGFIVLKDGKIVIEQYFGTFTVDSLWYWASAGKSMTAFLVGLAQEDGLLDIHQSTSEIIGEGWTNCTTEQEAAITVLNQLTMTTGLDDTSGDVDCTDPNCLNYLADPGTRWAYHNAPYTLLDSVLFYATGESINIYLFNKLSLTTGIYGAYLNVDYNNVLFSKTRMLARFGSLCLNNGTWNGNPIMSDQEYFYNMTHTSQELNKAYGYLWWLNGSDDYMLPGIQFTFDGPLMPDAPMDVFAAMGKNGQIINVSPSQNLVVVRVGNAPTNEIIFVPNVYNNTIWQYLNAVICTSTVAEKLAEVELKVYPNPASESIRIQGGNFTSSAKIQIIDTNGQIVKESANVGELDVSELSSGRYQVVVREKEQTAVANLLIAR